MNNDQTPTDPSQASAVSPPTRGTTGIFGIGGASSVLVGSEPTTLSKAGPGGALVEQVGRYRILEKIGEGGMAGVYRAYDPAIERTIAIKFLHGSLCLDKDYRARFLREARAAGGLSNPNIVTVFDVGEIEGRPFIAMELLDGTWLNQAMAGGKPLPVREVVEIGIQLARALDYAHSHGVFHRDIKPSNIVRLKNTNNIKVTDFGIARIENSEMTQHTKMGDVIGTPQYMSPEQALGHKVDGRSDLFSAGVVLYQLLTGQRPFEGDSVVALMVRIAKEEPPPLPNTVPTGLRRAVERCLRKQPERRYQTGRELAADLIQVIHQLDEAAAEKAKPRILPLRVKWTLIMALVVAVTMGLTAAVVTQRQYASMMDQVMDYGASLSRFIAKASAVNVLGEEWVAVEVFVGEIMKTQDFQGISVLDERGAVRVSSEAALIGQSYRQPGGRVVDSRDQGVNVRSYKDGTGATVLDFDAPITFAGKEIGRVHLGIFEKPIARLAQLSLVLMAVLVLVTVGAVVVATYFLADRFSKPIKAVGAAMRQIGVGRYDVRIGEERNDEFGLLYRSFDEMAAALQARHEPPPPAEEAAPAADPQAPLGAGDPLALATAPTPVPVAAAPEDAPAAAAPEDAPAAAAPEEAPAAAPATRTPSP